jgi:hypothetical protein
VTRAWRKFLFVGTALAAAASVARGGHELPVYPSYYPHEIAISTVPPERAAGLLREAKIQAYLGGGLQFPGNLPASIRAVESLGSFVLLSVNPASPLAADRSCDAISALAQDLAGSDRFVFHPYAVTPLHGDYFYHVDRAEAARQRFRDAPAAFSGLKIKAAGPLAALLPAERRTAGPDWDVAIEEVDAAGLVASAVLPINGWLGPAWVRTGWFQAERLLADALDGEARQRAGALEQRLSAGDYRDTVERINLERDLLAVLTDNCRKIVLGYTISRQYFNAEFTDGVENVGFDAMTGLASPMFIRTVKLKNFPWNGWLALALAGAPEAAWNPIAGFTDDFGRALWSTIGDPALLPAPYDSGWMLNRVATVESNAGR